MKELTIWLCDLTYTQQTVAADTIPMAIGCIAEYTEKKLGLKTPIQLFKYPEDLAGALQAQGVPDIIGFSNYCWNLNLSSGFAKLVKHLRNETVVIFGGPNYPIADDEREEFLREHREIDYYVAGEGEAAFANLLSLLRDCNLDHAKISDIKPLSVHFVSSTGHVNLTDHHEAEDVVVGNVAQAGSSAVRFVPSSNAVTLTDKQERLTDLNDIPSPYTSGRLDKFFDGKLMPLLQTNRGCPFSCTFCVEGDDYYNKIRKYSPERVRADVEYMAKKMYDIRSQRSRNDLFIADSNFGMYPTDIHTAQALADTRESFQWPEYINVATGKNNKERVIHAAEILNGALRLSGSVQSLSDSVLENIKRKNISAEQLIELGLHAKKAGVNSYSEIILGLPGDSKQAHFDTIRKVMDAGFNIILPWQLMLINGSELGTREQRKHYKMDVRYRVFPRCFGSYDVGPHQVTCAEIEDVCVGNDTLSFEDYLECRRLNLFVAIFYNDSIFSGLLKLFRILDMKTFSWIETMLAAAPEKEFGVLVNEFIQATVGELYTDKQQLMDIVSKRENVERYVKGELGRNLLYYYRTLAITQHVDTLKRMAQRAATELLEKESKLTPEIANFLDEMLNYHSMRIKGIFDQPDTIPEAKFHFDFVRFERDQDVSGISDIRFEGVATYRFPLKEEQIETIKRNLAVHGSDSVGVARILSRVFVKKLYRHVEVLQ